jgi:hypothetical protein
MPLHAAQGASIATFIDVSVVPMDRERVLAHHTVVVREGRIEAVSRRGRHQRAAEGRRGLAHPFERGAEP